MKVTQSCLTARDPLDCNPTRLLCMEFSSKNTGVSCHSLLWVSGAAGVRPNRDKVTQRERSLQGSSSSLGAAPGARCVPSGAAGTREEPAGSSSPPGCPRGPGMSLAFFCLTVVGLSINFWKYIVIRPPWKSPSLFWKCS